MPEGEITRREFVGTTLSAVAAGSFALLSASAGSRENFPEGTAHWRKEGVLFLDRSPHAKLRNIPVQAVTITKGFWEARRTINVNSSIPSMLFHPYIDGGISLDGAVESQQCSSHRRSLRDLSVHRVLRQNPSLAQSFLAKRNHSGQRRSLL